jgi:hypothetical protein
VYILFGAFGALCLVAVGFMARRAKDKGDATTKSIKSEKIEELMDRVQTKYKVCAAYGVRSSTFIYTSFYCKYNIIARFSLLSRKFCPK